MCPAGKPFSSVTTGLRLLKIKPRIFIPQLVELQSNFNFQPHKVSTVKERTLIVKECDLKVGIGRCGRTVMKLGALNSILNDLLS
jgi:hypothetical protein